jgi:hypothetical protein
MGKVATLPTVIERLVDEIREHMEASLVQRLQAALKLVELRKRVEDSGEDWWTWFEANEHRFLTGRRECQRLLKIGNSPDPAEAMEAERSKAREGMKRLRATNVSRFEEYDQETGKRRKLTDEEVTEQVASKLFTTSCGSPLPLGAAADLDKVRSFYLFTVEAHAHMVDLDEERRTIMDGLREIAGRWPQDGRSEVPVDDPTPENEGDDLGDIPACLDRRRA